MSETKPAGAETNPDEAEEINADEFEQELNEALNKLSQNILPHSNIFISELVKQFIDGQTPIHLRITEEPLTPQNLAIILTALSELITKFWLIAKRRFADLIEYTQTHDTLFSDEAGTTIAWIIYNSPLNFGLNVDKVVPGVAEAVMTVVDGLTQRKAHLEQLELENQAAAQKIKEAEQKIKQQQEMAAIERDKQELELEKQRLENEKERQALVELRLEMQKKQIVDALVDGQ